MPHRTRAEIIDDLFAERGVKLSTRPGPHAGGEWDAWFHLMPKLRRRIIGMGWAGPTGQAPDVVCALLGNGWTPDELIHHLAQAAWDVPKWRARRHGEARQRLARRSNPPAMTYHRYREAHARTEGHASYRAKRAQRGWTG